MEYRPSDEEFEEEDGQFREYVPRREYQGREARTAPRRGPRSPAEVTAPQLRYLFKVPKYVPMEGKYSVLKVRGRLHGACMHGG